MNDAVRWLNAFSDRTVSLLWAWELQILILGGILFLIDTFMRRAQPRFHYGLWVVLLAKSFLPPLLILPFIPAPAALRLIPGAAFTPSSSTSMNPPLPAVGTQLSMESLFFMFWLLGAALLSALVIWKNLRLAISLRSAVAARIEPGSFARTEKLNAIRVFSTDRVASPFSTGIFRPRIYLTPHLADADDRTREVVLAHECAHILRRDTIVLFFQTLAQILHPFNPLVWAMNIRLARYRELSCDAYALRATRTEPRVYGNILIDHIARACGRGIHPVAAQNFFETKKGLALRLLHIVQYTEDKMSALSILQKGVLGVAAIVLFASAWQCGKTPGPAGRSYWDIGGPILETPVDVSPIRIYSINDDPIFQSLYRFTDARMELNQWLRFAVDLDEGGRVKHAAAVEGASSPLAAPLLAGIRDSKWTPARRQGKPVACRFLLPIRFSYTDRPGMEQNPDAPSYDVPPKIIGGEKALQNALILPPERPAHPAGGRVMLKVMIQENGWVCKVQCLSSPDSFLTRAAIAAVERVAWQPGYKNGKALSWAEITLPVSFDEIKN